MFDGGDCKQTGGVDRGLFPDEAVREQFPLPERSRIEDPADDRRVRAVVVDLLEHAAAEGHTLLPRSWVIRRARERALQPPCPLGENVLDACEESFAPVVARAATRAGEPAYQVDRLIECRTIIRREVLGRKRGKPHTADLDWRGLVDAGLDERLPADPEERRLEERARREKAAALEGDLVGGFSIGAAARLRRTPAPRRQGRASSRFQLLIDWQAMLRDQRRLADAGADRYGRWRSGEHGRAAAARGQGQIQHGPVAGPWRTRRPPPQSGATEYEAASSVAVRVDRSCPSPNSRSLQNRRVISYDARFSRRVGTLQDLARRCGLRAARMACREPSRPPRSYRLDR